MLAYLDNIGIFSQSFEEHKCIMDMVLGKLETAGVTLCPEKCVFGSNEVNYLGYYLRRGNLASKSVSGSNSGFYSS